MPDEPKIQIDSDWKAQAQAEREKLKAAEAKAQEKQAAAGGGDPLDPDAGGLPPANFDTLVQTFVTNALLAMGAVPDPQTGQRYAHLGLARHHIDMLGVVEEKSKGNLTKGEQEMLSGTLHELRSAFVQLTEQARAMAAQQAASDGVGTGPAGPMSPGGPPPAGSAGAAGGIITPG